jgi:uncharacterized protein (TIGR00369 family)
MKDQTQPQRKRSGFRSLIGYRTKAWREGYGEVGLDVGPQHLNSMRVVHGGVYATLIDAALGHAIGYCTTPGNVRFSATVSLSTTFIRSAADGALTATGRLEGQSGRLATASAEVRDAAGNLLATGQGTFLYAPGSERLEGVPRAS